MLVNDPLALLREILVVAPLTTRSKITRSKIKREGSAGRSHSDCPTMTKVALLSSVKHVPCRLVDSNPHRDTAVIITPHRGAPEGLHRVWAVTEQRMIVGRHPALDAQAGDALRDEVSHFNFVAARRQAHNLLHSARQAVRFGVG